MFVLFCQLVFENGDTEGDYKWLPNLDETEIVITDSVPIPLDAVELRPHVQLVTAGYQNQNLGFDHKEDIDMRTGKRTHLDLVSGNASFNVHAKNEDVARRLARFVRQQIIRRRRDLISLAKLHQVGHVAQVGPASPPGALVSGGPTVVSTMVPVMFPFFYADRWTAEQKVHPVGEASEHSRGTAPKKRFDLVNAPAIQQINVDARMLKPGVVWNRTDGLRQIRSAPLTTSTARGRAVEVVRRLDEAAESTERDKSPHVRNKSVTKDQ